MRDSNLITREYFDSILLEMRHMDAVKPVSSVTFFREFSDPYCYCGLIPS